MMKKIGIISMFYNNFNYGGQLQAYALTNYLRKKGYDAEQICCKMGGTNNAVKIKKSMKQQVVGCLKNAVSLIKNCIGKSVKSELNQRAIRFREFQNTIPHSEKVYTNETIGETNQIYDLFITGSDQVWNFSWYNPIYFLDFVLPEKRKISYAASMTSMISKSEEQIMRKHLESFSDISVREKSTVKMLSEIQDNKVQWVLDPTLLLNREEWDDVCAEPLYNEKYVFAYFLGEDLKVRKLSEKFAKKKGLRLVTLPHLGKPAISDLFFRCEHLYDVSAKEFISLIKNAEYVITNSFHAGVFSNIYSVKHFIFSRKGLSMDERIHTLLDVFNAEERFCVGKKRENLEYMLKISDVEGSVVTEKFKEAQCKSIEYLDRNLFCLN